MEKFIENFLTIMSVLEVACMTWMVISVLIVVLKWLGNTLENKVLPF